MSDVPAETPLTELCVVDFTHFIAGPFCTMILGDFGADVIKIESPDGGDGFRQYPPHRDGEGAPHLWTNRNKASVALDLKTKAGRDVALALTEKADIVVENFSTGVMQRLATRRSRRAILASSIVRFPPMAATDPMPIVSASIRSRRPRAASSR
jgi:crotonobetainyl-CoA:carnitine CoA-transferase CaiB-like acyl-CoA transferase